MKCFKIKHKPSGLFWQPHKHRGSTLSKTGKIYGKKSFAESALKTVHVQVAENSVVHKLTWNIVKYNTINWSRGQLKGESNKSDWEIVEL